MCVSPDTHFVTINSPAPYLVFFYISSIKIGKSTKFYNSQIYINDSVDLQIPGPHPYTLMRLRKGVLGREENGVKKYREQGAKESNLGSRELKILLIVSNILKQFSGFFFASLRSAIFGTSISHFHQQ